MLPEQQQRILGYFIEEAREHLTTIEQGLLNLESTLKDSQTLNEVFRAAHSVKGGAAMLGLSSIQRTAHRLEDCFKVLKENPVQIDQKLETLFLNVSDILKALLENLQGPFALTEEVANDLMSEAEPYFNSLHEHLESLVKQAAGSDLVDTSADKNTSRPPVSDSYGKQQLQTQVLKTLREMLQLFKQEETPESRQELEDCCQDLAELGEELDLVNWSALCLTAKAAIANSKNSYLTLAKVAITSIKQALELVAADKETEIVASEQLDALIDVPDIEFSELTPVSEEEEKNLLLMAQSTAINTNSHSEEISSDVPGLELENVEPENNIQNLHELFEEEDKLDSTEDLFSLPQDNEANGPHVGNMELTTLADIFTDENSDLDESWEKEEGLNLNLDTDQLAINFNDDNASNQENYLADLFSFDEPNNIDLADKPPDNLTLVQLFGDQILEDDQETERRNDDSSSSNNLDIKNTALNNISDINHESEILFHEDNDEINRNNNYLEENGDTSIVAPWENITDTEDSNFCSLFPNKNTSSQQPLQVTDQKKLDNSDNSSTIDDLLLPTTNTEETIGKEYIAQYLEEGLFFEADSNDIFTDNKFVDIVENKLDVSNDFSELDSIFLKDIISEEKSLFHEIKTSGKTILKYFKIGENQEDINIFYKIDDLDLKSSEIIAECKEVEPLYFSSALDNFDICKEEFRAQSKHGEPGNQNNLSVDREIDDVIDLALIQDDYADLTTDSSDTDESAIDTTSQDDFADLEALLDVDIPQEINQTGITIEKPVESQRDKASIDETFTDGFKDLEEMLKASTPLQSTESSKRNSSSRTFSRFEQLMKVPVKHLDDMSNLVGELVVNRNSLEQDQERLRQSLDNLLNQVQQLSDVGARMQELYEHSLLEASLLASRNNNTSNCEQETDRGFTELEIDRFTPFHSLSQEMIELIVRVRESSSDIDFVVEEAEQVVRQFRQVTTQLQEGLTRARMEPFSIATDMLPRGVRDNAIKSGKQVKLDIQGRDTLIDKMILEHLGNPLNHLLNNAIAHGIETPEERIAAGKPETGTIGVSAFHQGNQTIISVSDDGAGINPEKVKAKALKMDLITPEESQYLLPSDTYELLFHPGFSTKDKADMLGGRGVGMDVVRTTIGEIRGLINVDSTVGKGTNFTIRLPLTLSICKALFCVSDKARIAFPMDAVEDTLDIHTNHVERNADGQEFITWHDTKLPFKALKELLTFNRQLSRGNVYAGNRDDEMISAIIVRSANNFLALEVDQVLNEQEIAIKQFEGPAPKPPGVSGATILADGRIMPIADVLEIIDIFQGRTSKQSGVSSFWEQTSAPLELETREVKSDPTVLIIDDSITVRELLSLSFNKAGYRVEQARDGQEAWDKLRSGLPCDLVFCDIEMPRCDGLELLSRIQKDPYLQKLPIAMLTSRGADKHRQMAIKLGASGYFTKPYLEEALLEAAGRMLQGEKLVGK